MNPELQRARAIRFRQLHEGPGILVLANAWDVGSARIFEQAGSKAIGTTSAGIAASCGLPDGECINRAAMMNMVRAIALSVAVPVTADVEAGYGDTVERAAETAEAVLIAGAVGLNLEDSVAGGRAQLADIGFQSEKIQAMRHVADATLPLVINARTDVYLFENGDAEKRFENAVRRANAYRKAGADCLFIPGVRDPETIGRLVKAIDGPLNILAAPGSPSAAELERLGVRRVSVGSGPMRATLAVTSRIARELMSQGTYTGFSDAISYAEMIRMFTNVS